jgi:hypothetical protein
MSKARETPEGSSALLPAFSRDLGLFHEHDGDVVADGIAAAALRAHDAIALEADLGLAEWTGQDVQKFLVDHGSSGLAPSGGARLPGDGKRGL